MSRGIVEAGPPAPGAALASGPDGPAQLDRARRVELGRPDSNEDRLCAMLGISRITVRHALSNLEEAGLAAARARPRHFRPAATIVAGVRGLTSFTDEMRSLACAGRLLLEARRIPAEGEIADALEIASGEAVVKLRRLRLGNGMPIGIQTAHLPEARVPGLIEDAANVRFALPLARGTLRHRSGQGPGGLSRRPRRRIGRRVHSAACRHARLRGRAHLLRRPRPLRIHRLLHAGGPL